MKRRLFVTAALPLFLFACSSSKDGVIEYMQPTYGYSFEYPEAKIVTLSESSGGNSLHLGESANISFTVMSLSDIDGDITRLLPMGLLPISINGEMAYRWEGIGSGENWFSETMIKCDSYIVYIQYSNPERNENYETTSKEIVESFKCND